MTFLYKLSKQYAKGGETLFAEFKELNDARAFATFKVDEDRALNVNVTYLLMEGMDVIETFSTTSSDNSSVGGGASAGGKTSTASFRPTPFNTTPKPGGTPAKWLQDDDEEEEKP